MKLLRQYIRGALLSESIHPKISAMIDKFEDLNAENYNDLYFEIAVQSDWVQVELKRHRRNAKGNRVNPSSGEDWAGPILSGRRVGVVEAQASRSDKCWGAWEVVWSKMDQSQFNIGPLLYDMVMEIASLEAGGLMADRNTLSSKAWSVWQKYLNLRCKIDAEGKCTNTDIEIRQLDHKDYPTTKTREDDCSGGTSQEWYAKTKLKSFISSATLPHNLDAYMSYWQHEDPLSKVYVKKSPDVIRRLSDDIVWSEWKPRWAK